MPGISLVIRELGCEIYEFETKPNRFCMHGHMVNIKLYCARGLTPGVDEPGLLSPNQS